MLFLNKVYIYFLKQLFSKKLAKSSEFRQAELTEQNYGITLYILSQILNCSVGIAKWLNALDSRN
jgi:hypothetical protein